MKIPERSISIAALIISLASALFSYLQFNSSEKQLRLNAQQLRPHVSYLPTFFPSKRALRIDMYLQNQSPLPAHVMFTDLATSVDGKPFGPNFQSIRPDILYQERGGISTLPPINETVFAAISDGRSELLIATCAVYSSTARTDERRWMIKALHEYSPGATLPIRRFITEQEVPSSTQDCSAKSVLAELAKTNDSTKR